MKKGVQPSNHQKKVSVLYTYLLFQNETLSSYKVKSSTDGFISAASSGTHTPSHFEFWRATYTQSKEGLNGKYCWHLILSQI